MLSPKEKAQAGQDGDDADMLVDNYAIIDANLRAAALGVLPASRPLQHGRPVSGRRITRCQLGELC